MWSWGGGTEIGLLPDPPADPAITESKHMAEEREIETHGGICVACKHGMVVLSARPEDETGDVTRFCNQMGTTLRFMGKVVLDCSKFQKERKR